MSPIVYLLSPIMNILTTMYKEITSPLCTFKQVLKNKYTVLGVNEEPKTKVCTTILLHNIVLPQ